MQQIDYKRLSDNHIKHTNSHGQRQSLLDETLITTFHTDAGSKQASRECFHTLKDFLGLVHKRQEKLLNVPLWCRLCLHIEGEFKFTDAEFRPTYAHKHKLKHTPSFVLIWGEASKTGVCGDGCVLSTCSRQLVCMDKRTGKAIGQHTLYLECVCVCICDILAAVPSLAKVPQAGNLRLHSPFPSAPALLLYPGACLPDRQGCHGDG